MPEDLARQIEPLHELVRAHGWPLLMVEGVEADDVIGTLAVAAAAQGIDCVISTSDKDLAQLVRSGIKLVNTMSNETLDEAGVLAKFGVRADQVLDLLALTGDAVDNVPGVPKVGPKTAAKWLTQYGTLDAVIAHAGEVPGVVGDNLRATLDWLPQGKRLLTVKTDCVLVQAPTDLGLQAADVERLKTLYERFEFKAWLRDGSGRDPRGEIASGRSRAAAAAALAKADRESGADAALADSDRVGRADTRPSTIRQRARHPLLPMLLRPCPGTTKRCWTSATLAALAATNRDARSSSASIPRRPDSIRCGRSSSDCRSRSSPVSRAISRSRTAHPGVADQLPFAETLARFAPWFADASRKKVGQNVKYDQHVLANHGLVLRGVAHDTLLQSYVLEAHRPHDMDNLAWRHLNVKTITYADVVGKGAKQIDFDQVGIADATAYAAEDADIALQLHRCLYPRLAADPKLDRIYTTIEMPVREVLYGMERDGVMLDAALLAAQSRELGAKVMALEQQAYQLAGQPFNLASPKQLGEILFDKMKLPTVRKTATGQPSTDEDVLTLARGRLSVAESPARAPRAVEAEVDLHGQAAADGQSATPAACTRRSARRRRSRAGSRRSIPICRTFRCARRRAGAFARRSSRPREA